MDVLLTLVILWLGDDAASEVNPIAWFVIDEWGGVHGLGIQVHPFIAVAAKPPLVTKVLRSSKAGMISACTRSSKLPDDA